MWLVLLVVAAVGLCWYLWRQRNERIAADEVRSILNSRIEEFKKVGSLRAFQDRFFTDSVKDDLESGIFPPEDIEKNRMRALNAEREGRGLFKAVVTLEAVLKHSRTKAEMISLMEHYVLEFGRGSAAQEETDDVERYASSVAVAALNGILAQVKK